MDRAMRRRRLLQIIRDRPASSVRELAGRLGVSESTIYRDLKNIRRPS